MLSMIKICFVRFWLTFYRFFFFFFFFFLYLQGEMCGASSSVAPSTTEIPASSTVPPTPSPSIPSVDNYTVSGIVNGSTVVCLVMQAAIKLKIPYEGKNKVNFSNVFYRLVELWKFYSASPPSMNEELLKQERIACIRSIFNSYTIVLC